jgi:hypothetical protein
VKSKSKSQVQQTLSGTPKASINSGSTPSEQSDFKPNNHHPTITTNFQRPETFMDKHYNIPATGEAFCLFI